MCPANRCRSVIGQPEDRPDLPVRGPLELPRTRLAETGSGYPPRLTAAAPRDGGIRRDLPGFMRLEGGRFWGLTSQDRRSAPAWPSSVFAPPRVVLGAVPIEAQEVARFDAVLAAHVLEQSVLDHVLPAGDEALAAFGIAQVDRAADFNAHGNRQPADSWVTSSARAARARCAPWPRAPAS